MPFISQCREAFHTASVSLLILGALIVTSAGGVHADSTYLYRDFLRIPISPMRPTLVLKVSSGKAKYSPSDPIKITFTVKNDGKAPQELNFSTAQKFDLEIRRGSSLKSPLEWQWSHDKMFAQMLTNISMKPGQTITFSETFKPGSIKKKGDVLPISPGTYLIVATLTTMPKTARMHTTASFIVK